MTFAAMLLVSAGAFAQSSETPLKGDVNEDGKVNVYDDSDNAPADKVVKTVSVGKALLEFQEWGNVILYERQPNGSMKKSGRVNQENIDYDEE